MIGSAADSLGAVRAQIGALKGDPNATKAFQQSLDKWMAALEKASEKLSQQPAPPAEAAGNSRAERANAPPPDSEIANQSDAPPPSATQTGIVDGGGPNTIRLGNTTDKEMRLQFRQNDASESVATYITVQPGQTVEVSMPSQWSGNIRRTDESSDTANLAELTFDGNGKVIYDESDETGRNASILMSTPDGQQTGSDRSILNDAPEGSYKIGPDGEKALLPSKENGAAYDLLSEEIGSGNTYIQYDDHLALRTSVSSELNIDFGKA